MAHKPVQSSEEDFEYDTGYGSGVRTPKSSRFALWFVAGIVIIALVLAFSLIFSGAESDYYSKAKQNAC